MSFINKNLEFYDTNGVRQASKYDSDSNIWKFELTFDPISTDLFSTQQIHIFEKVINILNGENKSSLLYPMTTDSQKLKLKFKNRNYKNFFIYRIVYNSELKDYFVETVTSNSDVIDLQTDNPKDETLKASEGDNFVKDDKTLSAGEIYPGIKKITKEVSYDLRDTSEVNSSNNVTTEDESYINDDNIREVLLYDQTIDTITVNVGFMSPDRGEFSEVLELYLEEDGEDDVLLAEISLFCEAEAEDTRLTTILENFGQRLDLEDSLVFRETDVNDDNIDHKILNEKKKELILEYSNIIPFIGAYKGLINALKFYGYNDLKIKEWWLNLDTEKFHQYEIDKQSFKTITNKDKVFGEGNRMKRTGKFSLFYDLFKLTGEVDRYGIPEIEKAFPYSQDEVLIKLYGLKDLFKRKYLPLSTRIIDITGEGIVFDRISTQTWNTPLTIGEINSFEIIPKIEADPTLPMMDKLVFSESTVPAKSLSELSGTKLNEFSSLKLEDINREYHYKDTTDRRSYAKVTLKNRTFENRTLQDLNFIIEDAEDVSIELAQTFPVYELQYDVICNEGKGYRERFIGTPAELEEVELKVDVVGNYDVIVTMRDIYNGVYITRLNNIFSVELPEPRFSALWNETKSYETIQDAAHLTIEEADFDFVNSRHIDTKLEDIENITLDAFEAHNYLNQPLLKGTYRIPIKKLDRDGEFIEISTSKLNKVEDIEEQTYLTVLSNWNQKEVYPKDITKVDEDSDSLIVTTDEIPELGDIIEVFEFKEVSYGSLTINDKNIEYGSVIDFSDNMRFYIYNESNGDVAYLEIEDFTIDKMNSKTKLTVLDPDGLLERNYTKAFFMQKPRSLEVKSVTKKSNGVFKIELTSTVDMNLSNIQSKIDSGIDMRCWWNLAGGRYSIPIRKIEELNNDTTKIWLDDKEKELFRITDNFDCLLAEYDINYAEKRLGITTLTVSDLADARIEEIEDMEIDETELHISSLPGFIIKDYTAGSSIKIGDGSWFQFSTACSGNLTAAVNELNDSSLPSVQKYDYIANDTLDQIHAISKNYGEDNLDVIEFENVTVEPRVNPRYACNYQLPVVMAQESNYAEGSTNNRMLWNLLLREWVYQGETFEIEKRKSDRDLYIDGDLLGNFQRHYGYAMNGNFRFYNTKGSEDLIRTRKYKLLYFQGDNSEVIGKQKYEWKFIHDNTDKVVGEVEGEFVSFLFTDLGSYSVELTVTDWNGNITHLRKPGFVFIED